MADLTTNRTPNRLGPPEACFIPQPCAPPGVNTLATNVTIFSGALCGYDATGKINNIDSGTCVTVAGVASAYMSNVATAGPNFTSPSGPVLVKGPISFLNDGSITGSTTYGTDLYAVDNQTLSTSDNGGLSLRAGFFECLDPSNTANVICQVGQASPLATAGGKIFATPQNRVRNVITTLGAYGGTGTGVLTATANGAMATEDGVTQVAGDVVLAQGGTTNVQAIDTGPWVVTSIGGSGAKVVLTRPDWWTNGSTMPTGTVFQVGPEGTLFAGTEWKCFATPGSAVVGTNDPKFYPSTVIQQVTLASSTVTISNVPILSATKSVVLAELAAVGGTTTNTVGYGTLVAPTPGYVNTASAVIDALASGMTKNGSADTSVLNVMIKNW